MSTEPKLWTLSTLRSARADADGHIDVDPANPVVFTIPQFQRSLVWPQQKQRDLIESILKGFPLGCLLLVEYPNKKDVVLPSGQTVAASNYGIIDGLQRTNAIVSHLRESLVLAGEQAVLGQPFDDLHATLEAELGQVVDPKVLSDAVVTWMVSTKEPDVTKGFDFDTMLKSIQQSLGIAFTPGVEQALKPFANVLLNYIHKNVDISNMQIPVLVYKGPTEYLPEIFERINTAGTMLSKYEVYAAAWVATEVEIMNTEVRDALMRRYQGLKDEGFDVDTVGAGNIHSLFDYLHGLSQVLGERYPKLFSSKMAENNALSGAFPIAAFMLGHTLDKMADLNTLFPVDPKNPQRLQVAPFEKAMFEAASLVNSYLAPFLAFQFVSDSEKPAHGELQVVSMIASVAVSLTDPNNGFKDRGSAATRNALKKKFEKALPQHYIYDIIRQFWRGSLYTYAAERVWSPGSSVPSKAYTVEVDIASFDSALKTLFAEHMAAASHSRRNVTAFDRVFLRFVYSRKVSVQDQAANKFDVEHWIPVKRLQDLTANSDPWAMSAMGNLGVLPMGANRIKREETVHEYVNRSKRAPTSSQVALLEKMLFVPMASVSIPKDASGKDAMTAAQFEAFVRLNWDAMCVDLKQNLGL